MMGGKPCIRGMRVTVGMIAGQIGAGHNVTRANEEITNLGNGNFIAQRLGTGE